jgi:hypothetical protein
VIYSLVYITVDFFLSLSSKCDYFPPHFNIFFAQYNPSHITGPFFTPFSLTIVKKFVWIGLHEPDMPDMLLSQNLFHIFNELSCMVVKGIIC